ncbi:Hint domain-containing protein [uncultured Pelagimonas sp.]|uniref:Hint domain-containing protein n=1 Tax=uncultured Pelagimonas sp. TaxID=1618102 RepID=UPI002631B6D7|nr:Hint domain-containing protein [uncultured Pelagimonas sp.]
MSTNQTNRSAQTLHVYRAEMIRVINGANLGDSLSFADELVPDDVYRLSPLAATVRMRVQTGGNPPFQIASDTDMGLPGADLHLDCCVTFMSPSGETVECLVLVEVDEDGNVAQIYTLPLGEMTPNAEYVLVGVNSDNALQRFAQVACVSFTAGTMITMANGAQRPVEDLAVGDRVLTRDDGPQEIRWLGHHTARAVGAFTPILIREGTLNNTRDLLVCPDHRLFIYQRSDEIGAGRSEILVRARHLVNDITVMPVTGGFIDYYQMLFDSHQIIYAEGIAAESMLVDTRTGAALPDDMSDKLGELIPGHRRSGFGELEVQETLLTRPDVADLLRKSSTG